MRILLVGAGGVGGAFTAVVLGLAAQQTLGDAQEFYADLKARVRRLGRVEQVAPRLGRTERRHAHADRRHHARVGPRRAAEPVGQRACPGERPAGEEEPEGVRPESHFGSTLISFIISQYHYQHVTQPLLLEQLDHLGIDISAGQLNGILTEKKDSFHDEKTEVLLAGLEVSSYVQVDDTGARHQGHNGFCTHIGNELFAYFESTDSKSRQNFLEVLRGPDTDYTINDAAAAVVVFGFLLITHQRMSETTATMAAPKASMPGSAMCSRFRSRPGHSTPSSRHARRTPTSSMRTCLRREPRPSSCGCCAGWASSRCRATSPGHRPR